MIAQKNDRLHILELRENFAVMCKTIFRRINITLKYQNSNKTNHSSYTLNEHVINFAHWGSTISPEIFKGLTCILNLILP